MVWPSSVFTIASRPEVERIHILVIISFLQASTMNMSEENDAGAPLPDFRASGIQLQTVAPSLGVVNVNNAPDYLDYDPKGRGIVVTMFANSGMAYLVGIGAGGMYGFRQGLSATPSTRFRVQLNSVLNHCGRYGSRAGNTLGVFAVLYSLFEGFADNVSTVCLVMIYTLFYTKVSRTF